MTRRLKISLLLPSTLLATLLIVGCRHGDTPGSGGDTGPAAVNVSKDPWLLVSTSPYQNHGAYLGNGFLGMRFGAGGSTDSPDGKAPADAPPSRGRTLECIVSGLYVEEHLVPAPDWGRFRFVTGAEGGAAGTPIFPEQPGSVDHYRQTLNLRYGELVTSWRASNARPPFQVELTTRVHRDHANLVTFTARITPEGDGSIGVEAALQKPPADGPLVVPPGGDRGVDGIHFVAPKGSQGANQALAIATAFEIDGRPAAKPSASGSVMLPVKTGKPVTVTKWVYVDASAKDDPAALDRAIAALAAMRKQGISTAVRTHRAAWERLWTSDIRIDGDLEAQHAVRSSLFYLLCSAREGGRWSIPPMGLSGVQWGGHLFWDADMWMFPVLGLLHPKLAVPIVDYRFATLAGARKNAAQRGPKGPWASGPGLPPNANAPKTSDPRGYEGADYATESAVTGIEMAPAEFPFERHNTADVAIAQWRQFLLDGDRARLEAKAYPILRETATYWASRVVKNAAKDRYEIRHVISPDETAHFVDNDLYTNAAARYNLEYAIAASRLLGKPYPPEWKTIAEKLWLPFDPAARRYLEHEGYHPGRQKAKQADAQLLFFPLGFPASDEITANTLDFHAANTSPVGPAMTASVHAVIAAGLAEKGAKSSGAPWIDRSRAYFQESYRPFLRPPFNDFSEKRPSNNTTFLTGCAGVAMAALYGFGGIRYDNAGIQAKPILPTPWTRLKITGIHYRGDLYDLELSRGKPRVWTRRGGAARLLTRRQSRLKAASEEPLDPR